MELYRVTWVDPAWSTLSAAEPFHPLHVPLDRQGGGRFDNPTAYVALYASTTPQGAIGETLGNSAVWIDAEIGRRKDGRPRCLVRFEIPDDTPLVDLDDARVLGRLGLRPSDVVRRNRDHTQEVALSVWLDRRASGAAGLTWWSYWRPEWTPVVLWSDATSRSRFSSADVLEVSELSLDHPGVLLAADVLPRERA